MEFGDEEPLLRELFSVSLSSIVTLAATDKGFGLNSVDTISVVLFSKEVGFLRKFGYDSGSKFRVIDRRSSNGPCLMG